MYTTIQEQDRQCTYNVGLRGVHATIVPVEKQLVLHILIMFVALNIQHAMRMCRVILSSVAYSILPNVSTLSHKRHHYREQSN